MAVAHPHKPLGPEYSLNRGIADSRGIAINGLVMGDREPFQNHLLQPLWMERAATAINKAADPKPLSSSCLGRNMLVFMSVAMVMRVIMVTYGAALSMLMLVVVLVVTGLAYEGDH